MATRLKGSILVTGTNAGLGTAIVSRIAGDPKLSGSYYGLYTVRDASASSPSASNVRAVLDKHPKHQHELVALDLASLASVRKAAQGIKDKVIRGEIPRIRALVLNAGFQEHTTQTFTADGFDMTWQVNYLANFLFTLLLLDCMDKEEGRILLVGSWTHDPYDSRNDNSVTKELFKDPKWKTMFHTTEDIAKGKFSSLEEDPTYNGGMRRYGASKLCVVMFMHELSSRIQRTPALSHLSVLGLDPGGMPTAIGRNGSFFFRVVLGVVIAPLLSPLTTRMDPNGAIRTTEKSAADVLRACFGGDGAADAVAEGKRPLDVYMNGSEVGKTGDESRDKEKSARLWSDSVAYAGLDGADTVLVDWR